MPTINVYNRIKALEKEIKGAENSKLNSIGLVCLGNSYKALAALNEACHDLEIGFGYEGSEREKMLGAYEKAMELDTSVIVDNMPKVGESAIIISSEGLTREEVEHLREYRASGRKAETKKHAVPTMIFDED